MTVIFKNRVRDNTTTTGTGTITLSGSAPTGYQSFAAIGNLNETYYQIVNSTGSEWEIGRGTYTSSGTTLSRDFVLSSSNSSNKVNFSAGTKTVIQVYPAALHAPGIEPANKSIRVYSVDTERRTQLLKSSNEEGYVGESAFSAPIVSTFSLVYTTTQAYQGGVLSANGEIHFVPHQANRGQKLNPRTRVVSTYPILFSASSGAYSGGVLAPNGDIHFIPSSARVGQRVSASGIVSTYSLVFTTASAYNGGILAPNGDIYFMPLLATRGQAFSTLTGLAYTYSLLNTVFPTSGGYHGGVLTPNGEIYFVPRTSTPILILDTYTRVQRTISLFVTAIFMHAGGVLNAAGDEIHFTPSDQSNLATGSGIRVGQKVNIKTGLVSTYSLVATTGGYYGSVLAPNGDIHFIASSQSGTRGQKINTKGIVSTYSTILQGSNFYHGGVLDSDGNIYFVPWSSPRGQVIQVLPGNPFPLNYVLSPNLNKL